ncbi:hypothetical protein RUM43_015031 [Polyplax serrata]|uniref:Uncharacterized protein n=1 Tax=Polyplax serrata TaxID=468196 RepID=A0AAN8NPV3_POLSC
MWSLQFTSLVILAGLTVDAYYELRVSDSYREDAYGKAIVNINSQEVFNDNVVKYKMEKTQDNGQICTITDMLTMKLVEENSECKVKLNYKGRGETSDRAADHDGVPLLEKATDVEATALKIQKMENVSQATRGLRPNWKRVFVEVK